MLWKLVIANIKMTVRDKQAIFWSLLFPTMFIIIFGLFNFDRAGDAKYVVIDNARTELSAQMLNGFNQIEVLKRQEFTGTADEAKTQLKNGDIDFVLVIPANFTSAPAGEGQPPAAPDPIQVVYDNSNLLSNQVALSVVDKFVDQMNLQAAGVQPVFSYVKESVQTKNIRYIDILMPGILGMAIMMSAVIGISTGITRYRERKLLKRLSATPLKVRDFLIAEVLNYLLLNIAQITLIILVARLAFHVHVFGSYFLLYAISIFGSLIFLNIGFAIAGYAKNTKTAEAVSQIVTMPMMFFSGVFFSTEALPGFARRLVAFLPLTPMIDALRKVAVNAESIPGVWTKLTFMAAWVVVSFLLAWRAFRFKDS